MDDQLDTSSAGHHAEDMADRIDVELSGLKREQAPDGSPGPWRATFFLQLGGGSSVLGLTLPEGVSDDDIVLEARARFHGLMRELVERKRDWER